MEYLRKKIEMKNIDHLYIHIPFCTGKCSYCSFFSKPYDEEVANLYVDKLIEELKYYQSIYKEQLNPKTIYIGGGTPTTLSKLQLEKLLISLYEFKNVTEFTIETNPGLLSEGKLELFKKYGVNRVSMGVQSLDDGVLKYLNRRHTAGDVEKSLELLKRYEFENVSIDLISSLPNVSKEDWERTIEKVSSWDIVKHISVYCLSIEDGTKFADMIESGCLVSNTDDHEFEMGQVARELLIILCKSWMSL
jgi:oxygen-independent coproporphyrinogen-3 oxidase